ncbi:hypothetical protein HTS61_18710 [Escherichia coli]|nr:hypothetical protein [Escherichia coli]
MRAFRKNPALHICGQKIPKAIPGNAAQLKKHHHADHQCQWQIKEKNFTGRNMRESINVGENGQD